ncbi:hypothetical protein L3V82_13225 [Thiotrichales bacterium 19S3-7]|nr:hypothetical protein [Thiotrichales bacterium 19S3-7]MCF6803129.1 hypothetical protein [Thiotrichales bacterium 19S3-11]
MNINALILPRKNNLIGEKKPKVLIVNSPHDARDSAVNFKNVSDTLAGNGYQVINLFITFDSDLESLSKAIKSNFKGSKRHNISVVLNSHGALGWLFSGEPSFKAEINQLIAFTNFIHLLGELNYKVDSIMLNTCYSAAEVINLYNTNYVCSPARLLSNLLPDVSVLGYVGTFAEAIVTGIYSSNVLKGAFSIIEDSSIKADNLSLLKGSVLFKGGKVSESNIPMDAYVRCDYVPHFVADKFGVVGLARNSDAYFLANVQKRIDRKLDLDLNTTSVNACGKSQVLAAKKAFELNQSKGVKLLFLVTDGDEGKNIAPQPISM